EYTQKDGTTSLSLKLYPGESVFIVFTRTKRNIAAANNNLNVKANVKTIEGPWKLTFPQGWGAPGEAVFDNLISWTDSEIDGIKYFSGTATYHKSFSVKQSEIDSSREIIIDLGEICDLAEVYINNKSAGILWKKPYVLNIKDFLKAGNNELRIEVVNQWVNRLTGDMLSNPADRFCRTNQPYITKDDAGFDNWAEGGDETFRLKDSGLLGPVNIIYVRGQE
ncbi:MAG: hypothetical protein E4G95_07370, partial [Bacteroidia bacterium]